MERAKNMREKGRMILYILIVLLAFSISLSINKALPHYIELRSQLKAENDKLSMLKQRVENLPEIVNKKEAAMREFYELLEELNVDFDDDDSFLLSVNPPQSGLRITKFRPSEEGKLESLSYKPFEIEVAGDYGDLVGYLVYLENLKALIEIRELKIDADEKNGETIRGSFIVRLYKLGLTEGVSKSGDGLSSSNGEIYREYLPANSRNIFKKGSVKLPGMNGEK
ncbi:type 4a pilus biogenesis protein PilO [Caldanaerovirga acetigignens]|nr:type 4a pilus biogenesis protein PilO [Caldanaerovirga acetigignens]